MIYANHEMHYRAGQTWNISDRHLIPAQVRRLVNVDEYENEQNQVLVSGVNCINHHSFYVANAH